MKGCGIMMKSGSTRIEKVEERLIQEEQVDCPVVHHFSPGVYVREITMPKDSVIVGHKHNTKHLNIVSKGSCILVDLDTEEKTHIEAPYTFESEAGVRKVLYIVEECVWSTVHVTEETDLDKIEEIVIDKSNIWLEHNNKVKEVSIWHG